MNEWMNNGVSEWMFGRMGVFFFFFTGHCTPSGNTALLHQWDLQRF